MGVRRPPTPRNGSVPCRFHGYIRGFWRRSARCPAATQRRARQRRARRGSRGLASSDEDDRYRASASTAPHRRHLRSAELRRHRQSACHQGSGHLQPRTSTAHPLVFGRLVARFGSASMTHLLAFARTTRVELAAGWHSQLSWAAGRRATLVSHLYSAHEPPPEFLKSPRRSHSQAPGSRTFPGTLVLPRGSASFGEPL